MSTCVIHADCWMHGELGRACLLAGHGWAPNATPLVRTNDWSYSGGQADSRSCGGTGRLKAASFSRSRSRSLALSSCGGSWYAVSRCGLKYDRHVTGSRSGRSYSGRRP